jgi:uncharacterized protein (TIGR02118 family)
MCKLIVVIYRRRDFTRAKCQAYLRDVHGPLAERIPGVIGYRQNHVIDDPSRRDPAWDAVVELWWNTREAMESAWQTPEGQSATDDLHAFVDLERTSWSIVDEQIRR